MLEDPGSLRHWGKKDHEQGHGPNKQEYTLDKPPASSCRLVQRVAAPLLADIFVPLQVGCVCTNKSKNTKGPHLRN